MDEVKKTYRVSDYIAGMMQHDIESFKTEIKTGFGTLDLESGGIYAGLYCIAAVSSLGKTTFSLQVADQIAASGTDVLYFSLEQSRFEMVTKSLARVIREQNPESNITSLDIRKGKGGQAVQDAALEYIRRVGDHMNVIEGNFTPTAKNICDEVKRYCKEHETRPVVFIDYLQILRPEQTGSGSTRETIDNTVTDLKKMSRTLNIPIFVISAVNRNNYMTPIAFESLKESGGIEYTCDVVYGLQLQCMKNDEIFNKDNKTALKRQTIEKAKAENPRKIELVCLKNRYGNSSFTCNFDYYKTNDLFMQEATPFDKPRHRTPKAAITR